MVAPDGTIQTLAGGGKSKEEGAAASDALLEWPGTLAVGADGTVYSAYPYGKKVKAVVPTGE